MILTSPPFFSAAVMASKVASTAEAAAVLVMLALPATVAISSFLVIAKSFSRFCPESAGFATRAFAENPLIASRIGWRAAAEERTRAGYAGSTAALEGTRDESAVS